MGFLKEREKERKREGAVDLKPCTDLFGVLLMENGNGKRAEKGAKYH